MLCAVNSAIAGCWVFLSFFFFVGGWNKILDNKFHASANQLFAWAVLSHTLISVQIKCHGIFTCKGPHICDGTSLSWDDRGLEDNTIETHGCWFHISDAEPSMPPSLRPPPLSVQELKYAGEGRASPPGQIFRETDTIHPAVCSDLCCSETIMSRWWKPNTASITDELLCGPEQIGRRSLPHSWLPRLIGKIDDECVLTHYSDCTCAL